ncbi:MAG: tRNA preQ1(34) S-adenosylmethionine ribosyltransferase-isomerase QueA [Capsulimonas sp.]|uniref:tRNA preQ1(34) S-adenosylmethionine ribosyltransferase-isomerase QueA n=1 Tax=Capsulimonas sp. TaxID=2494211 RepID=UPI0032639154
MNPSNTTALDEPLRLSDFDYTLPPERIAQSPLPERDSSRLLVLDRKTGATQHRVFTDLLEYFRPGDVLVINDTRVTAQRLFGARVGKPDERVEAFLTHRIADGLWRGLVRPGKKLQPGVVVEFGDGLSAEVRERTDERGGRILQFSTADGGNIEAAIEAHGAAPLPPYITRVLPPEERGRYQTVYADEGGSAAAPTAGLHFTQDLLSRVRTMGVEIAQVTLHVGLGTFRPIEVEHIADHTMHAERIQITPEEAEKINGATGRVIAVGTTSARTLESAAVGPGRVVAVDKETSLYCTPGYNFQVVDALVTNFHMPRSTLLVLVSAFAGREAIFAAYGEALAREYRFLSFGDAMFIH